MNRLAAKPPGPKPTKPGKHGTDTHAVVPVTHHRGSHDDDANVWLVVVIVAAFFLLLVTGVLVIGRRS